MYSLEQIRAAVDALETVDGEKNLAVEKIDHAIVSLKMAQDELDGLAVKGRKTIDTLLGCMLAVDAVIGKEEKEENDG